MYCPKCGKEVSDESNFCMHCGHSFLTKTQDETPKHIEYEYYEFESSADENRYFDEVKAYGAAELNRDGLREAEAKLHFWQKYQSELRPEFQKLIDEGWEPVTEIGPACLKIRHSSQRKNKGLLGSLLGEIRQYWELTGAYVKFRRPKPSAEVGS